MYTSLDQKHACYFSPSSFIIMECLQLLNPFQRVEPKDQFRAHRISTITSILLVEVTFYMVLCAYLLTKVMDNVVCMNNGNVYADTTGGRSTCISECPNFVAGDTCFDSSDWQNNSIVALASICALVFCVCVAKMWWIQKHDTDYEFPQYVIWADLIFTSCMTAAIGVCLAITVSALQGANGDSDLKRITTLLIVALGVGFLVPIKLVTLLIDMQHMGIRDAFSFWKCCMKSKASSTVVKA